MEQIKNQKLVIHIPYKEQMTLSLLEDSLHTINDAFAEFYEIYHAVLNEMNEVYVEVFNASQGTFTIDVTVCVTDTLVKILGIIIKNRFHSKKGCDIIVCIKNIRISWTEEDTYKLIESVLKEYVLGKGVKTINDFINSISLSNSYGNGSIRMKIQNIKQLINEKHIPNVLNVPPLNKYSKMLDIQFSKACKKLNIV